MIARPNGTPFNMSDKVTSLDVAYAIAQAALLPADIEKEKDLSYDALMKYAMQTSVKVFRTLLISLFLYFLIRCDTTRRSVSSYRSCESVCGV